MNLPQYVNYDIFMCDDETQTIIQKGATMETFRQLGNYQVTKTDAEFYCVFKLPRKRLLAFCLAFLVTTIVFIVLCVDAIREASFPLFLVFFGVFEVAVLCAFTQILFGKETLTMNANGFLHRRALFCFCRTWEIPIKNVEKITCNIRKKENDENCVYGTLHISAFSHPSIKLIQDIPEDELREMFHLIRETYGHIRPNDPACDEIFVIIDPKADEAQ